MIPDNIDVVADPYGCLENGFIFISQNSKKYEYKFFDISKLANLIYTAEGKNNKIPNLKEIIESLINSSIRNYLNENHKNIVSVIFNLNLSLPNVAKRCDFYGFQLWSTIHKYFYDVNTGQNGKSPHPSQPYYVFCSFLDYDSIKSMRKESYIFDLEGHQFLRYPFKPDVLREIKKNVSGKKYNLVCPGAYLLYSGYQIFLEKRRKNEINNITNKNVTFIDDKHYEWSLVLNKIFKKKIKCFSNTNYKSLSGTVFMDFYLNENHKIEYLMNKNEVMQKTGAKEAKYIRGKYPTKEIIMFTESSKIPYYKILEKEAEINGWYTKQTYFGDNYKQKAENTFFDFLTALTH